jgi:hypothetical protein
VIDLDLRLCCLRMMFWRGCLSVLSGLSPHSVRGKIVSVEVGAEGENETLQ